MRRSLGQKNTILIRKPRVLEEKKPGGKTKTINLLDEAPTSPALMGSGPMLPLARKKTTEEGRKRKGGRGSKGWRWDGMRYRSGMYGTEKKGLRKIRKVNGSTFF